jgi:SAM-dependent methyltransferase
MIPRDVGSPQGSRSARRVAAARTPSGDHRGIIAGVEEDRVRWDTRYATHPLAEPSVPDAVAASADARSLIPARGRGADIACGPGGQTLWLAGLGLDVLALDVSPTAVELTRRAAAAAGLDTRISARVHDFDDGLPDDVADLDVLVCQRFRATALYREFVDRLKPGGVAVVTVLSTVGLDIDGGPFHARPGELVDAYRTADVEVIHHCEAAGQASIVVRRH